MSNGCWHCFSLRLGRILWNNDYREWICHLSSSGYTRDMDRCLLVRMRSSGGCTHAHAPPPYFIRMHASKFQSTVQSNSLVHESSPVQSPGFTLTRFQWKDKSDQAFQKVKELLTSDTLWQWWLILTKTSGLKSQQMPHPLDCLPFSHSTLLDGMIDELSHISADNSLWLSNDIPRPKGKH